MAAVQNQDTLAHRLSDEEYKNWLKAGLCIFRVKEGLESFVTQESDALHKTLLAISNPCGNCVQDVLKNNRKLCTDCEKFKGEIKKRHKFSKPIWDNTNVQNWSQDAWSVARCFMNSGQSQHASAADADISALLNFIIHCKVFCDHGTYGHIQQHADKVREHRNDIFHKEKDKLKKTDLSDWTKDMIQLLENENPDGKLKSNAEAKKALTNIKEILGEEITITLKDENTIKIAYLEAQMDEKKTLLQKLQKDSTSQGQKVETVTKDVDTIQAAIKKIHESLDNVRTHQTMTDKEVSKRISDMEDKFKSVRDDIEQLKKWLYKVGTDVENLKSYRKEDKKDIESLKSDRKEDKKDIEILKSDVKEMKKACETRQNQNSETKTTDLSSIQKRMIESYKPHQKIQLNPAFLSGRTSRDLGDFYTNVILEKEQEEPQEAEGKTKNKNTGQIKSFMQLFWNANVPLYRIALKGKAGLGKSTFLKFLLRNWCTFHNIRLNKVREGLVPTLNESSDEWKDGDVMLKFDILLFVNLGKISDEKDIIDVIGKQIPCLDHRHLPDNYLHDLMSEPDDNKVLMLMDALDEMDVSAPSTPCIEQIIKGLKYPTMTVIVGSRPWNIDQLHQSDPPASIDLLIDMKGFSEENSKLFAEKFLNCYKTDIKQFWDDVSQNDNAKTLIHMPIIALILVQVWRKDKSFPQTVSRLYLKMLDIIGQRYIKKTNQKGKFELVKFKKFPELQKLSSIEVIGEEFLLACCNIAYQFLIDGKQESPLAEVLNHLGNDSELKLQKALQIGLLSRDDCTEVDDDDIKVIVSFPHRIIQELLAAISVCCVENNFTHFLDRLKTYHDVIQNETIITFIAGISSQICEKIFEKIYKTCEDQPVYENRNMAADLCTLFMKCVREAEKSTRFTLKHLYIDRSKELNTIVPSIKNIQDIRSLMLKDTDFTSDNCKGCFNIFECDNLECLELQFNTLNDIDWKRLLSPQLISLQLNFCMFSRNSELQCDTLSQCTKLKHLQLDNVKLGDDKLDLLGASCLSELKLTNVTISSLNLSKCTKLEKLTLRVVKLGDDTLDLNDCSCLYELLLAIVTISSLNLSKYRNLKRLALVNVEIGDDKLDLLSASCLSKLQLTNLTIPILNLSKCTKLDKLTLKDVKLGDDNLDLQDHSCLSQVKLTSVTISSLNLSKCTNLKNLALDHVKLGDHKLDLLGASCLSQLELEKVTISSLNLSQCTKLKRLTLKDVKLCDDNLDLQDHSCLSQLELEKVTISSLNLSKCTNLDNLTLDHVKLDDYKLELLGASCLSQLELENVTIFSLNLSQCTKLKRLTLKDVELCDHNLDLQDHSCLSQLNLENVTIFSLVLSKCTKLNELTLKALKLDDDKLDLQEISCLSQLKLENVTISSLNLSKCTNLKQMLLSNVKLGGDKLDLLGASCLSELKLTNVTISSLNLSKCTKLEKLTLTVVKLGDDTLDLNDCSCLYELKLENVTISSLNLSKCTNLKQMLLSNVKLGGDKLDLLGASCLSQVWLASVTISSLNLSKCTNLENLALDDVKLGDHTLDLLSASCLSQLELANVTIVSLNLSQCTKLKRLTLNDVKLFDDNLDLQDHSCLYQLELENVTISSLNLSKCTNLHNLKAVKLGDHKLDLQDCFSLSELNLANVTISSLNLSKCTNLKNLAMDGVKLGGDKLDLLGASCLSQLQLENVTISSLNLSMCTNLENLTLNDAKLGDDKLDLQYCSCLSQLRLGNVTISSLNLSKCTKLNGLTLKAVKLDDDKLDLQYCSCLSQLELKNVTIFSLNVSQCTKLKRLTLKDVKVGDNQLTLPGGKCLDLLKSTYLEEQTLLQNMINWPYQMVFKLHDGKLDFNWQRQ